VRSTAGNNADYPFECVVKSHTPTAAELAENLSGLGSRERMAILNQIAKKIMEKSESKNTYTCAGCPRTVKAKIVDDPEKQSKKIKRILKKQKKTNWYCPQCSEKQTGKPRRGSDIVDTQVSEKFGAALYSGYNNLLPPNCGYYPATVKHGRPTWIDNYTAGKRIPAFYMNAAKALKLYKDTAFKQCPPGVWKLRPHLQRYFAEFYRIRMYYDVSLEGFVETLRDIGVVLPS
jgi:DNA-directed RNA polymerase subunit RPC12/RpoP